MSSARGAEWRSRKRRHYDEYPFGFDQQEILDEKLERRLMGAAIRATRPQDVVLDVGRGAGRVARLVARTSGARAVGLDLSMASLREAAAAGAGSLARGDNLRLPFRTGCADLVISNGVIHHTPDPAAAFRELARVTREGGRLVVSVYDRREAARQLASVQLRRPARSVASVAPRGPSPA
ncbi:MAG: class I SAM-dependent methyltransferase [Myxococcota bacterium]|nr:class I SAM-dependent methyltransferase [Myxococcota bacterium]